MDGVLILAHGSRKKDTEQTLNAVTDMVKQKIDIPVETAFMEFSEKTIASGLDRLVAQGARDIKAVPYFLFEGIHIQQDIPEEISTYLQGKAGITVKMGNTLGADPRLAEILIDRIRE